MKEMRSDKLQFFEIKIKFLCYLARLDFKKLN